MSRRLRSSSASAAGCIRDNSPSRASTAATQRRRSNASSASYVLASATRVALAVTGASFGGHSKAPFRSSFCLGGAVVLTARYASWYASPAACRLARPGAACVLSSARRRRHVASWKAASFSREPLYALCLWPAGLGLPHAKVQLPNEKPGCEVTPRRHMSRAMATASSAVPIARCKEAAVPWSRWMPASCAAVSVHSVVSCSLSLMGAPLPSSRPRRMPRAVRLCASASSRRPITWHRRARIEVNMATSMDLGSHCSSIALR
mmetsp:Transcript_45189/g.114400  ORF Transcript_45189/g.114400 Transcript_45189/m.114400 type:complete len:263 (-) Transcript_45189:59-847(-)